MTAPFPHHYHVRVEGGSTGAVVSAAPRPEFRAGAPAEFGGRDDWWSPEHLLLSAAGLCLKTTFDAFAARARVPVLAYTSRVLGTLDKTSEGLAFTSIAIEVEVVVAPEHGERAGELLQTAKKHCIVANALKAPVELIASVRPAVPTTSPV